MRTSHTQSDGVFEGLDIVPASQAESLTRVVHEQLAHDCLRLAVDCRRARETFTGADPVAVAATEAFDAMARLLELAAREVDL